MCVCLFLGGGTPFWFDLKASPLKKDTPICIVLVHRPFWLQQIMKSKQERHQRLHQGWFFRARIVFPI